MSYSTIIEPEETLFIVGNFFICSVGLIIAIFICFRFYKKLINGEIVNKKAAYFAILSASCSIMTYLSAIFLCNDAIIRWNYSSKNAHYSALSESINIFSFSCGKISFYYGFTYHILYLYNDNKKMAFFLKIWMLIFGLIASICCVVYIIDDALENSSKETGYLINNNMYITMYLSHRGATLSNKITMFTMMMVDSMYFGLLIFLYLKKLKVNRKANMKTSSSSKIGVVLMVLSSITYLTFLVIMSISSPLKWIFFPIDIIVDDICLFFMFYANKVNYVKFMESDINPTADTEMPQLNSTQN